MLSSLDKVNFLSFGNGLKGGDMGWGEGTLVRGIELNKQKKMHKNANDVRLVD